MLKYYARKLKFWLIFQHPTIQFWGSMLLNKVVEGPAHIPSHCTWGPVPHYMILEVLWYGLWTLVSSSDNFMVRAFGSCVKGPSVTRGCRHSIPQNLHWAAGRWCLKNICIDWFEWLGFPPFVSETLICGLGSSDRHSQRIDLNEGELLYEIGRRAWCTAACHHALLVSHIGAQGDRVLSPRRWH